MKQKTVQGKKTETERDIFKSYDELKEFEGKQLSLYRVIGFKIIYLTVQ
jgi:hypothetical protein